VTTLSSDKLILGFDIGGTKTGLVLGTLRGDVLNRAEFATPANQVFETAFQNICSETERFLQDCHRVGLPLPREISVSVGGPLDIQRGILFAPPHLAAWGNAPLKPRLEEHFQLPVWVEHDGNAGALAEWMFGAGCGLRHLVFLTLGTGLGAGIIVNGAILHGATDMAGEVGHIRIAPTGPVQYGKAGSWEGYCSGAGLALLAHAYRPERWGDTISTREIVSLALAGDLEACEVVRQSGDWLGKGLAILVDILNPEAILLGTLGVVLGDLLIEPARRAMLREALPAPAAACRLLAAGLGKNLGDVASLMAAIIRHKQEQPQENFYHPR
jgi:glucokinase